MFQLESEIQRWRQSLVQHDSIGAADASELESHLRDLISNFQDRDLTDQEAFMVATGRLGTTEELVTEFDKVNADSVWRIRILWMLGGYVAFGLASRVIGSLSVAAAGGVALAGFGPAWMATAALAVLVLAWSILLRRVHRQSMNSTVFVDQIPRWMCVWAVIGYVSCLAISRFAIVPLVMFAQQADLGMYAMINGIGAAIVHAAIFIACVVMMWKISRPACLAESDMQPVDV